MPRSGTIFQIGIVTGAGIRVMDHSGYGCAAGVTIQNTRQKLRTIRLLSGCGPVILSRRTAIQKGLQFVKINRKSRWDAIQRHADGRSMGLTENGQF